jgi:hypothetical protein
MGSTVCVSCGETLIPLSYCDVCHEVLCFTVRRVTRILIKEFMLIVTMLTFKTIIMGIRFDTQKLLEEPN